MVVREAAGSDEVLSLYRAEHDPAKQAEHCDD
eukprot:CAMPEP_0204001652 /NCGR_PEP_ID=MMETSP0360-20130528/16334_1 /ASSEMBLY_ACC=CAM_ASM_000342 /TAXON_ID=268821 /ORGANISM="Scrippsiella Hangoei, Strain SHTV-5" /LENGTH=31 /DNA_ID= /DNA_START= /DNA_END= /DNA_ORIENTATION=